MVLEELNRKKDERDQVRGEFIIIIYYCEPKIMVIDTVLDNCTCSLVIWYTHSQYLVRGVGKLVLETWNICILSILL